MEPTTHYMSLTADSVGYLRACLFITRVLALACAKARLLPDVLWKPILYEVLIFMLVLANINKVVVFAGAIANGMEIQNHTS